MGDDCTTIREVDPARAEAVLAVRLFIPDVVDGAEEEYHLARVKSTVPVVESRVVNADGSVTETRTIEIGSVVAHCTYADGRTVDGRGRGFGKRVSIEGRSACAVSVHLSMYWTDRHGQRGGLDEELLVPWLGEVRRELAGGWVEARITRVAGRAEPDATPDPAT